MKLKPTTAQTVALHTIESVGLSALITVVVGIGQYVATNGLNVPGLAAFAGTLFVGSMSMVYKSLSTNTQVMAGINDTVLEARAAIQQDVQRLAQALTGGQPVPVPQLLQAPVNPDPATVADAILQHLNLSQVAQGVAQELMKIRVPQQMPSVQPIPQRPTVQQPTYLQPQATQQPQPPRAG